MFSTPVILGLVVGAIFLIVYFVFLKGNGEDETPTHEIDEMVIQNRENMTRKEVAQHNTYEDLWVIVDNKVYDLTKFAPTHPGGDVVARTAGGDATIGFYGIQHPERAFVEIEDYLVGTLRQEEHMKFFTPEEVSKHNNDKDCWIIVNKRVYDVTKFLEEHAGGAGAILKYAGKDATKAFYGDQHPMPEAASDLYPLFVGYCTDDGKNPFADNIKKKAVENNKKLKVK
ncbi:hypothetical protein ABK040_013431 [Willaertia magna]